MPTIFYNLHKIRLILEKELRTEWRSPHTIVSLLMFSITTLSVISLAFGGLPLEPQILALLFWIVLFFSAMAGLSRVFLAEESGGTIFTLRVYASAQPVLLGKCLYNFLLLTLLSLILLPLFMVFLQAEIFHTGLLLSILVLGNAGIAVVTTFLAAVIIQAQSRSTLFTVLSFPLLLPILLYCIRLTEITLQPFALPSFEPLLFLAAYDIVMLGIASILFDFIWYD